MVATVGNHCEALHRSAFGSLRVDGLAPGHWAWVDPSALSRPADNPRP